MTTGLTARDRDLHGGEASRLTTMAGQDVHRPPGVGKARPLTLVGQQCHGSVSTTTLMPGSGNATPAVA